MSSLVRKPYLPGEDVAAAPPLENLRRAQAILRRLPLPGRLGRPPQHEQQLQHLAYLAEVWQAFLLSVNEKEVLESLLREVVLDRLQATGRELSLLDIGCDDGQLTLRFCPSFSHITMVEADADSMARLRRNVDQHRRRTPQFPDCRLIHDRFPCDALGDRPYDLVTLLHMLYFVPRDEWTACIVNAYERLRPGGMLVAAYICDEAALEDLIVEFGGVRPRFGEFEDDCRRALPQAHVEAYRASSVMCALEEESLTHLFAFFLADFEDPVCAEDVRQYARRFRRAEGEYVWDKIDGALVITRPFEE